MVLHIPTGLLQIISGLEPIPRREPMSHVQLCTTGACCLLWLSGFLLFTTRSTSPLVNSKRKKINDFQLFKIFTIAGKIKVVFKSPFRASVLPLRRYVCVILMGIPRQGHDKYCYVFGLLRESWIN